MSFATLCKPQVQPEFNRAVALLHSFTYKEADEGFHHVAHQDPNCAIAHWGSAMTHYHQLWDIPPSPADTAAAKQEITQAAALHATERERAFIQAFSFIVSDTSVPYSTRASRYEEAMQQIATANPNDPEAQVFYALALISNASPLDREHRKQKQAAGILEPLFRKYPDHPGIPHYLIHACDNQELASQGLPAARVYAGIAPSAPHALHMPSHIFTRLGLWNDSITSNLAARKAAQQQNDIGEELHAMDYLVYAYLQNGDDQKALLTIQQLKAMNNLRMNDFKVGYAATAMPIRYIVERQKWNEAQQVTNPSDTAPPQVTAIAVWARGLGHARSGHPQQSEQEAKTLQSLEDRLQAAGNSYWTSQVQIMKLEIMAWSAQASHQPAQAATILRTAADEEDGIEKLPLTPGPIVPAREQLGDLLLLQSNSKAASEAFAAALQNAPGRRGALRGAALASRN
ncbi:hypothetical protein [Terriglobus roseus]|uniref:hypothetical protein n=1 Tax=Terriglobus roseus TaxID=392734 RepID=UPI000A5F3C3A|nr:hypothetical protein [Terriglobus roseus]